MKKVEDPPLFNSIEVKGINGLSIHYIKRYFSHAGKVEEVKKFDNSVIVVSNQMIFRNLNITMVLLRPIDFTVELSINSQ